MNEQATLHVSNSNQQRTHIIHKVLVVLGMMTLMGGSLTGVMTYINLGYSQTFITDWISSFFLAAVTVMPAGFVLMALLTAVIAKIAPNTNAKTRDVAVGICMAILMESSMAFTTTLKNIGLADSSEFFSHWLKSFLSVLPVALTLMVIVSVTIKPKIEKILKG